LYQSQKFPRSLSATGSAFVSAQEPLDLGRKNLQLQQERRSFPQSSHLRERPIGSASVMAAPQYQHISLSYNEILLLARGKL
jgi:hypothetical protein